VLVQVQQVSHGFLFDMSRHKMPTWWANRCV
jgi:hypothetical protein